MQQCTALGRVVPSINNPFFLNSAPLWRNWYRELECCFYIYLLEKNLFHLSQNLILSLNNARWLLTSITLLDNKDGVFGLEDNSKVNPKLDNLILWTTTQQTNRIITISWWSVSIQPYWQSTNNINPTGLPKAFRYIK